MTRIVVIAVCFVALLWTAATRLTQVEAGERAVVRRFGRVQPHRPGPGLYCGLPWGMERVDRVPVGKARRVSVGFTGKEDDDPAGTPAGQLLTGDHNLVNVQVEVYYKVNEDQVEKFALQSERVDPLLARLSVAALAEWVVGHTVDEVLVQGQRALPAYVQNAMQAGLGPLRPWRGGGAGKHHPDLPARRGEGGFRRSGAARRTESPPRSIVPNRRGSSGSARPVARFFKRRVWPPRMPRNRNFRRRRSRRRSSSSSHNTASWRRRIPTISTRCGWTT